MPGLQYVNLWVCFTNIVPLKTDLFGSTAGQNNKNIVRKRCFKFETILDGGQNHAHIIC